MKINSNLLFEQLHITITSTFIKHWSRVPRRTATTLPFLKYIESNLQCYAPENWSKLISKSAKMAEIGKTLLFPFQMTCIDSKVSEVIPILGILADLEINLDEFSGV